MKTMLLVLLFGGVYAQDVQFSQFYANPLYLAPSFAGSHQSFRAVLNYRDHWPKVPGTFVTSSFSVDYYFARINSGMGLFVHTDNAGQGKLVTTNIGYSYSYKVRINQNFYFQPGLKAYYYNRRTDYSSINFSDEFFKGQFVGETSEVLPYDKVNHADFAISGLGFWENYWFGINADHLMTLSPILRKDERYANLRLAVFGGGKFYLANRVRNKKNRYFHAAVNYWYQSKAHQLDIGAYYHQTPAIIGLWYRGIPVGNKYFDPSALIFLFGVKRSGFTIGYTYDMTIGKMISQTGGSHEISLIYSFGESGKTKPRKRRPLPCPEF